ncbi:MAG: hypothetical protein RIC06_17255 [Cyclobacteriaceae bacterium]
MKTVKLIVFGVVVFFIPTLIVYQFILLNKESTGSSSSIVYTMPAMEDSLKIEILKLKLEIEKLKFTVEKITNLDNTYPDDISIQLVGFSDTTQLKSKVIQSSTIPHISASVVLAHYEQLKNIFELDICENSKYSYCVEYSILRSKFESIHRSITYIKSNQDNIFPGSDFSALLEEITDIQEDSEYFINLIKEETGSLN